MSTPEPLDTSAGTATTLGGGGASGELVLDATTAAEFMAMLRTIGARSGRKPGQLIAISQIPRSTVYRYLDPKTTALPKSRSHVEAFARACRLNTIQVNRVLWLWDNLTATNTDEQADATDPVAAVLREPRSGAAVIVNGNYNVTYGPRPQAQPEDDDTNDADDTDHAYSTGAGTGRYGSGPGGGGPDGPRGHARRGRRGSTQSQAEFSRILLTVLDNHYMWRRLIILIMVAFLGVLALASSVALLGRAGAYTATGTLAAIATVLAVNAARHQVRRRRR